MLDKYHALELKNSGRSSELSTINIDNIFRQHYKIENDSAIQTNDTATADFNVATVNFHSGESRGYAILSDNPELNKVYLYIENGSVSDTSYITPLKWAIEAIPQYIKIDLTNAERGIAPYAATVNIDPILKTNWSQGAPFNSYMPECSCAECASMGGHNPAGCVTIATAQFIAKCGRFKGTFYGTRGMDFPTLSNHAWPTASEKRQISAFVHEVALYCQVRFKCGGSSSTIKAAYHYLVDLGYNCQYIEGNIDNNRLQKELSAGIPHLIGGRDSDNNGHMWVVDGYRTVNNSSEYHNSWGWGSSTSNGWQNTPYTTSNSISPLTYPNNLRHIYTTSF